MGWEVAVQIRALLPSSKDLVCESIHREGDAVIVVVNSSAEMAGVRAVEKCRIAFTAATRVA
jgi:hypothetical protein